LNDLPEPRARLRRVNPVRINRRPFHMINLPARKMRPVHLPILALRIRSQDECAFLCTNQYSYSAHKVFMLLLMLMLVIKTDQCPCPLPLTATAPNCFA